MLYLTVINITIVDNLTFNCFRNRQHENVYDNCRHLFVGLCHIVKH